MGRDYWWYDTEDGQDIWKKVNFAAKCSVMASVPLWSFDVCFRTFSTTFAHSAVRYCSVATPLVGGATLFAFTSQMLCRQVPQVDPKMHYALSGFATGSIVGSLFKKPWVGVLAGFYFSLVAATVRYGHEQKWLMPWEAEMKQALNDTQWDTLDLTLTKPKDLKLPSTYTHLTR